MSKYIIKNCPAYSDYCEEIKSYECQDCTDCIVKQIIEKCKKIAKDHYWGMREIRFSKEILQIFDIEEIKE